MRADGGAGGRGGSPDAEGGRRDAAAAAHNRARGARHGGAGHDGSARLRTARRAGVRRRAQGARERGHGARPSARRRRRGGRGAQRRAHGARRRAHGARRRGRARRLERAGGDRGRGAPGDGGRPRGAEGRPGEVPASHQPVQGDRHGPRVARVPGPNRARPPGAPPHPGRRHEAHEVHGAQGELRPADRLLRRRHVQARPVHQPERPAAQRHLCARRVARLDNGGGQPGGLDGDRSGHGGSVEPARRRRAPLLRLSLAVDVLRAVDGDESDARHRVQPRGCAPPHVHRGQPRGARADGGGRGAGRAP